MPFEHDFVKFPELSNSQMAQFYFQSPHRQIQEDFDARVVEVHDGDTITVQWEGRDFDFPVRFLEINAPELKDEGGAESRDWLKGRIEDKVVTVGINKYQRVGKYGRLLGNIIFGGSNINKESLALGFSKVFGAETELQNINKELKVEKWL